MFCKKCGKEIPDDSRFCPYCAEKAGDEKKSKSNSTIVIACVAVIVALLVVIAFMAGKLSDKKGENDTTTSSQTSSLTEKSTTAKAPKTTTTTTKAAKAKVKCYSGTDIPDCGAYLNLKANIYEPVSEEGLIMYESPDDGLQRYAKLLEDNSFMLTEENEYSQIYTSKTGSYAKLMEDIDPQTNQHYLKVVSKNLYDYCMKNFNIADNGI